MQLNATPQDSLLPQTGNSEATELATNKQPGAARRRHDGGVRTFEDASRKTRFGVQWRVDGQRKTEFYSTATDRDRRAVALRKDKRANMLALAPARNELTDWHAFKAAIGEADWRDVVAAWKNTGGEQTSLTVGQMVERYLREQDKRLEVGNLAKVTHKKNCPKAKAFNADFGSYKAGEVTGPEIEDWIDDLGFEAADTFNTYRKVIRAVFEAAKREVPHNPCDDIQSRDDKGEIAILTVEDTEKLFKYAFQHYRDAVPRLAVEAFAGLRFSSACRLAKEDVKFEDEGILLPAAKIKTRRRNYIDGLEPNLWRWLRLANAATWSLSLRNYRRLKSEIFEKAEVKNPGNALRHSFCSYHVAAFKNPGRTATLLCHTNQAQLWGHYNGIATQADGLRYFQIVP